MPRFIELSPPIEDGMPTSPGFLPEARVRAFLDHDSSRDRYQGMAEFHIASVEMPGNTGTYVDVPFHRFRDRPDLASFPLERLVSLPGIVADVGGEAAPVSLDLPPEEIRGRAVLFRSGWDRRWGTDAYWEKDPHIGPEAIDLVVGGGATLVGVDWTNVDDTSDPARPVHTRLLEAAIPIVEHLFGLDALPRDGFRFSAAPVRIRGAGSFPVRAFAELP